MFLVDIQWIIQWLELRQFSDKNQAFATTVERKLNNKDVRPYDADGKRSN